MDRDGSQRRDEIIAAIRRVADQVSPQPLTKKLFIRFGGISESNVRYQFGSWNAAVAAAGLNPNLPGMPISARTSLTEDELLAAIGELWRRAGRRPTEALMNAEGRFTVKPYKARWGRLAAAVEEYVRRFGEPRDLDDLSDQVQAIPSLPTATVHKIVMPPTIRPKAPVTRKPSFVGEPIDFRGLRYAPINEQGVVYLFGMVSRELGFLVESVRTDFPDCEAKRSLDASGRKWQHIRIEFEFRSHNFDEHGHDPDLCDLIICWQHDWPECPIEVLELKTAITLLPDN